MSGSPVETGETPEPSGTRPGRRLTPKGSATRARIIELATEAFATEGYAGASVRDLAARSGLSVGAIYGTFAGKADLLVEALEAHVASEIETLPDAVASESLPEIDAYQFEHHPDRERLRALLLEAAVAARSDPVTRARVHELIESQIDLAVDTHEEWRARAGVDAEVDMHALVTLLWSADLGLGVLSALGFAPPEPEVWGDLTRRLLLSLQAPGAQPGAPTPRPLPSRRRERSEHNRSESS